MSELERALIAVLTHSSGLAAREIAARLRQQGLLVSKRDINPFLYHGSEFENDGGRVPRWRLRGASAAAGVEFSREDRATARRTQRARLDRRQEAVASLRAGHSPPAREDSAVREAMALLRSRGYDVEGLRPSAPPPERRPSAIPATRPAPARRLTPSRGGAQVPVSPQRPVVPSPSVRDPIGLPGWSLQLRAWQQEALTRWYDAGGAGVCEAVTGTGKTHLGLEAVAQWMRRGERATVLVPSVLLQRQWEQQLQRFVPDAVVAKVGGAPRGDAASADVVVAVVNSALKRDLSRVGPGMTLLIADEVHRYGGEGWSRALRAAYPFRLGLTATLERGGDEGVAEVLLPYFGRVVHSYGYDRATREHVVAPFDLVFLGVRLDAEEQLAYDSLSRKISQARKVLVSAGGDPKTLNRQLAALRSVGGDVTRAVMTYESATRDRRRLLSDTPAKQSAIAALAEVIGESRGTVLFTQSKEASDTAAWTLSELGLNAAAIYSDGMTPAHRQRMIDALDEGVLDALAAPKILDEGVDIPDVDLGVVMGASSTRRQMIQRLGRVIRLKPDGRRARFVVLYAVDSVEDPEAGGRDDFMAEVEDAADRVVLFPDWDEETIDLIWSGQAPQWIPDPDRLAAGLRIAASPGSVPSSSGDATSSVDQSRVPRPPSGGQRSESQVATSPRTGPLSMVSPRPGKSPSRSSTRVSRPLPRPRRPVYPDPVAVADILAQIDETVALVEWVRTELEHPIGG